MDHQSIRQCGPFEKLIVSGESTVEGGPWLDRSEQRWADVLADLMGRIQDRPPQYVNDGIGACVISPRSPGYEASAKPSLAERYQETVIARRPDLWVAGFGLNDMRAGMAVGEFIEELGGIARDVAEQCGCLIVLASVYHMTGWTWFAPFDRGSLEISAAYDEAIKALAADLGALYVDVAAAQGRTDWLIHQDGVHANVVGNLVIAHAIFRTIVTHCEGLLQPIMERHADTEWTRLTAANRDNNAGVIGQQSD